MVSRLFEVSLLYRSTGADSAFVSPRQRDLGRIYCFSTLQTLPNRSIKHQLDTALTTPLLTASSPHLRFQLSTSHLRLRPFFALSSPCRVVHIVSFRTVI
jgi:hypothetical protein